MIRNQRVRRAAAAALVIAGGALMLLSPSVGPGLIAFAAGLLLEFVGWVLERRNRP